MAENLEKRVALLETELALLKHKIEKMRSKSSSSNDADVIVSQPEAEFSRNLPVTPWWEKIAGTFADNDAYDEAMQLGKLYRESSALKSF